jgi:hypothetical protein
LERENGKNDPRDAVGPNGGCGWKCFDHKFSSNGA